MSLSLSNQVEEDRKLTTPHNTTREEVDPCPLYGHAFKRDPRVTKRGGGGGDRAGGWEGVGVGGGGGG